jgi:hypothetical protein
MIPADEIEALATAAWSQGRGCDALVRLLRRIDPDNEVIRTLDARAREHGYLQAGSDERLPDRRWTPRDDGTCQVCGRREGHHLPEGACLPPDLETSFDRTARAVTGRSSAEINAELDLQVATYPHDEELP